MAYCFFLDTKHPVLGGNVRVCQAWQAYAYSRLQNSGYTCKGALWQADVQGLGPNLAYFMTRPAVVTSLVGSQVRLQRAQ